MHFEEIERFLKELNQAEEARSRGNEGMARVCARRAAGIVAGEYLARQAAPDAGPSAFTRLRALKARPELSQDVLDTVEHFLIRITTDHTLPVDADLIEEARWLAQTLLES